MKIRIEGVTVDELLAIPEEGIDQLALTGQPIVFRIGTAEVLGEFRRAGNVLSIDLAHIDGGGEGVLPALGSLVERYARSRCIETIEWLVRATNCAQPNPKLKALLERRGFVAREVPGRGEAYYLSEHVR
jgi:hypothetical protein